MKTRLKKMITGISVVFTLMFIASCHNDDVVKKDDSQLKIKITKISLKDLENKPKALERLKKFHLTGERVEKSSVYDEKYDFMVETDDGVLIENGDYHMITFPIYRSTSNGLLENLILKSNDNGGYQAFIAEYNFNAKDYIALNEDKTIDGMNTKTTLKYLPDLAEKLTKDLAIVYIKWDCEYVARVSESGYSEHGNGYTRDYKVVYIPINCHASIFYSGHEPEYFSEVFSGGV